MSSAQPFAGFDPAPSAWGYNWRADESSSGVPRQVAPTNPAARPASVPETRTRTTAADPDVQLSHLPAALLGALKRDKKPFTYTPGGVDLSEVLNARLQKRIERKKRYCEERSSSPRQVVVAPTYNTPLDMYSVENALEALEVQAGLVADDNRPPSPPRSATLPRNHTFRGAPDDDEMDPAKGVTQSKAFRVLQIITDTEEPFPGETRRHHQHHHHQHRDEMRFAGIGDPAARSAIPSRFFHNLQKITGTECPEDGVGGGRRVVGPQQSETPPLQQRRPAEHQADGLLQSSSSSSFGAAAALKRPAAFLPAKTTPGSGFRPVRPPSYSSNGPPRGVAGTNF